VKSYKLHRVARRLGDIEAAAKGPGRLGKRMIRRAVFVAVLGALFRKRKR
jgi:hypothetical protein